MNEIVREFLLETHENLAQLDIDLVTLEKEPTERETLARVFRTLHTVKGTAGFLGLPKLQTVAHAAENLLSRLRAGELVFNADIASGLLAAVDAIRQMLAAIEATEKEGDGDYSVLIQRLEQLTKGSGIKGAAPQPEHANDPPSPHRGSGAGGEGAVPQPAVASPTLAPTPPPASGSATFIEEPRKAPPAPSIAAPPPEPAEPRAPAVADSSIRVDVGLLDKLMTLVGELVLARNQIMQFTVSQEDRVFLGTAQRLNLLTGELQAGVMKTRMQPIGNIWSKFPRLVRDLSIACNKQVRLEMDGQETELDKTIIESIRDPLTHMVRNAIDHGIETPAERQAKGKAAEGRLHLRAFHEGGKVVIELTDDGAGIDPMRVRDKALNRQLITTEQAVRMSEREIVNLIFLPGFSTADKVTQFSGRGVGMDVVRTNIEKIGGTVEIDNRLGHGAAFKMKIPLTLAIIPALTVTSGGDRYAIPQASLVELIRLEGKGIELVHNAPVYRLRGNLLPIVHLHEVLQIESPKQDAVHIVVLQSDERQFGLVVDDIHDTEEIVVKPLQKQIKSIGVFSGATIMGDGKVALILDVMGVAQVANVVDAARDRAAAEPAAEVGASANRQTVVLFTARGGGRMAIPLAKVARLEEFPRSALERVGNRYVVQYRDEIMPLVNVARVLKLRRKRKRKSRPSDTIPVVVCNAHGRRVGFIVERILDIVEESLAIDSHHAAEASAVIQGKVTQLLDVDAILRDVGPTLANAK